MERGSPRGLLGALGAAAGMIPLLPAVRGFALGHWSPPRLPGAERLASDIKAVTYLESTVIVLAVPAVAVLFGRILPNWLASRTSGFPLLSECPGAAFAVSLPLWRLGVPPPVSLLLGALASGVLAAALFFRGGSPKLFSLFEPANQDALARILVAAAAWSLAWRSVRFEETGFPPAGYALVPLAFFLFVLAWTLLPMRLPGSV
jgi:hypothetical protein